MFKTAQDHVDIADVLNLQVVDALKVVERKYEEMKKKASVHLEKEYYV